MLMTWNFRDQLQMARENAAEEMRFDPVNLAKRIPKTTWVDIPRAGLGDESSPPNGVAVLWNNLRCRKSIRWVQGSTHGEEPPKEFREEYIYREGGL